MLNPSEIKLNRVLHGKNQDVLKDFPPNYFSSVITDPPYELGFMGRKWDSSGVAYDVTMWKEILRVAKPGATLFCFGGTRTYHRVACAIEDAGWQLKDSLMWIYGSGFPKSTDISKALDKEAGAKRENIGESRGSYGYQKSGNRWAKESFETEPATDIAKQWNGYGTALKPSYEPIILAQKPLEKGLTYAQNARKWGVAGLNIDAGRIKCSDKICTPQSDPSNRIGTVGQDLSISRADKDKFQKAQRESIDRTMTKGRWPANVILSHSPNCVHVGTQDSGQETNAESVSTEDAIEGASYTYACVPNCPIRIMDTQSGVSKSVGGKIGGGVAFGKEKQTGIKGNPGFGDTGGASRFFYTAKASRSERESGLKDFVPCSQCNEIRTSTHAADAEAGRVAGNCIRNSHPTVKPVSIMKYLCELIRMPVQLDADGNPDASKPQVILDPFCGSGSTLLAANEVGLKYIGIDMGMDNVIIASCRSIDTPPDKLSGRSVSRIERQELQNINPATLASNAQQLSHDDFKDLIV